MFKVLFQLSRHVKYPALSHKYFIKISSRDGLTKNVGDAAELPSEQYFRTYQPTHTNYIEEGFTCNWSGISEVDLSTDFTYRKLQHLSQDTVAAIKSPNSSLYHLMPTSLVCGTLSVIFYCYFFTYCDAVSIFSNIFLVFHCHTLYLSWRNGLLSYLRVRLSPHSLELIPFWPDNIEATQKLTSISVTRKTHMLSSSRQWSQRVHRP